MSEHVVRLSFPAKADYLLLARLALSGLLREAALEEELVADLKLAVTEACGNAVRHAYPDSAGDVSVTYRMVDGTLELTVEDQGAGFRVDGRVVGASPAGPRESGMGMAIMGTIVDELEVQPGADGRGTVVRMVKRF